MSEVLLGRGRYLCFSVQRGPVCVSIVKRNCGLSLPAGAAGPQTPRRRCKAPVRLLYQMSPSAGGTGSQMKEDGEEKGAGPEPGRASSGWVP